MLDNFINVNVLLSNMVGNVFWKDRQGIYRGVSADFVQAAGHHSKDTIIGKDDKTLFTGIMSAEALAAVLDHDQKVLDTGISITCEETAIDAFGKVAYYLTRKKALRDEKHNIVGIIGTSLDITDRKLSENFLIDAASNLQHDLKTPLINVQMVLDTLKGQIKEKELQEQLGFAQDSLQTLYQMCNGALESDFNLSQLKNDLIEDFCLYTLLKKVTDLFNHSAINKKITLRAETIGNFSDKLKGSAMALRSVLNNLVDNAIKFTDSGFVNVIAEKLVDNKDHCLVKFSVRDTGEGIPLTQQEQIFRKYTKIVSSEKTHNTVKSWGMGLYVVKRLVEKMGGVIQLQSKEGEGSQFFFIIPLYYVKKDF